MSRMILVRIGSLMVVLLVLTLAVFMIKAVLPADPVRAAVGAQASEEIVQAKRHELGYDKPLPNQYVRFLGNVMHGDFGDSLRTRRPVLDDINRYAPATIELALCAALLAGFLGILLGLWSAHGGRGSGSARVTMLAFASAPTFFLGILLLLLFYGRLHWLPASGRLSNKHVDSGPTGFLIIDSLIHRNPGELVDALQHLAIPAVCLALGPAVAIGRVLRSSLLDVMRQDYVRTARAKGLSEWMVVLRHALRNASGPALSMAGLQVGLLLAGVVVVELVFAWPGLGLYTQQSIQQADFPAIIGITLVLGIAYVAINAIVDVMQLVADPRLRVVGRAVA
ncbi:MAG: ABC-type dipeptide/oligopeptide/nickel transport system, permease component [Actinomycetia bacterium]|nr:ABC-type dipeptide/oligopeptide/nickel transport system, permease component [Actinomycetes bacterium]